MTETQEELYHALGVLEDFDRKRSDISFKKLTSVTFLGLFFICAVASLLIILSTTSYFTFNIFLFPLSLFSTGMLFLRLLTSLKIYSSYDRAIESLGDEILKDLRNRDDLSLLENAIVKIRIRRIFPDIRI